MHRWHKDSEITFQNETKRERFMTLPEYYRSLPPSKSPKTEFVEEICATCNVKLGTAKNWVAGKAVPANPEHREILAAATGLSIDELFPTKS